ncbi:MAG: exopolysaccharide biosynthesis WecB/TagA/CpsF family protein [Flavobacteriales bacterium]|jgi:N-acetylglucosaminyldiphosphoundecaprenol N-acetyl-beta-D-mannosaminyltransferase
MSTKPLLLNVRSRVVNDCRQQRYIGTELNRPISACLLLISLPIFILNTCLALVRGKVIFEYSKKQDCLGRPVEYQRFSSGLFKDLPMLWAVFSQRISLCGMPVGIKLSEKQKVRLQPYSFIPAGLFDSVTLHKASGLATIGKSALLEQQFCGSRIGYLSLLLKAGLTKFLYSNNKSQLTTPAIFNVFGLKINNVTMSDAVNWVMSEQNSTKSPVKNSVINNEQNLKACKTGCFANVNSVNLTAYHPTLATNINSADRCFADGSGLRLAAKTLGINIKDNVNGTDMLPYLCEAAQTQGVSIYLLGAKPGVAAAAAKNLHKQYPKLLIAGAEHGYFDRSENANVVKHINQSNTGILLLAMGSPVQEKWLQDNAPHLTCRTALAVGGLFDFYSGHISRAPMWMRELGLEWVWRLIQEPKSKFNRYVIGNTLFLIRTFVFNRASRGF